MECSILSKSDAGGPTTISFNGHCESSLLSGNGKWVTNELCQPVRQYSCSAKALQARLPLVLMRSGQESCGSLRLGLSLLLTSRLPLRLETTDLRAPRPLHIVSPSLDLAKELQKEFIRGAQSRQKPAMVSSQDIGALDGRLTLFRERKRVGDSDMPARQLRRCYNVGSERGGTEPSSALPPYCRIHSSTWL